MKLIKRIKWPSWIVLTLLSIGIIFLFSDIKTESVIAKHQMINSTGSIKYDAISKYPGLDLRTETEETEKYTISISIPSTESEIINESIQAWIEQQKRSYMEAVNENEEILKEGFIAHLNIQLDTQKYTDDIYTLLMTSYNFPGGANGEQSIKPFTVDVKNHQILQLSDILDLDNEETINSLQTLIKEEIVKNNETSIYIFEDILEESLKEMDSIKWSIHKNSLTIYFDEYEIAAGAAGIIKIEIPMEKLQAYLKNESKDSQKLEQPEESDRVPEIDDNPLDPTKKYIALTFDDGPSQEVTPRVLETLKQYDAKATFFMLGSQVEYYPTIAKQVAQAGHEVANHSTNHPDMTILDYESMKQEINKTSSKIEQVTGIKPKFFRPPYGSYNDHLKNYLKNNYYSMILWSVDSLDWQSRNASAVNKEILGNVTDGAIVLMHDIHPSTADALPQLLTSLTEEGYEFITVSELLSLHEKSGVGPFHGNY